MNDAQMPSRLAVYRHLQDGIPSIKTQGPLIFISDDKNIHLENLCKNDDIFIEILPAGRHQTGMGWRFH
jgi:hypothetical protein